MSKIKKPFFIVNPKSFLYGEKLMEMAIAVDKIAKEKSDISVFMTAPITEITLLANKCKNLIITAQHMESIEIGSSMGKVFAESLKYVGAKAVVLNHADNPLSITEIFKTIKRAQKNELYTIVCVSSIEEAELVAHFHPDVILAEQTELIGKSTISEESFIKEVINKVKKVSEDILVEIGAGIRTSEDIIEILDYGSEGVGVTSGIIKANNPIDTARKMITTVSKYKEGE